MTVIKNKRLIQLNLKNLDQIQMEYPPQKDQGEIIIIRRRKKTKTKSSISTFCSIKTDKKNECIGDSINI